VSADINACDQYRKSWAAHCDYRNIQFSEPPESWSSLLSFPWDPVANGKEENQENE
jgi:hypothetical protein